MNEILKKIDEEIKREQKFGGHFVFDKGSVLFGMEKIREIIQSEQKENPWRWKTVDEQTEFGIKRTITKEYIKTKGDVIRESNESLADHIANVIKSYNCLADKGRIKSTILMQFNEKA